MNKYEQLENNVTEVTTDKGHKSIMDTEDVDTILNYNFEKTINGQIYTVCNFSKSFKEEFIGAHNLIMSKYHNINDIAIDTKDGNWLDIRKENLVVRKCEYTDLGNGIALCKDMYGAEFKIDTEDIEYIRGLKWTKSAYGELLGVYDNSIVKLGDYIINKGRDIQDLKAEHINKDKSDNRKSNLKEIK